MFQFNNLPAFAEFVAVFHQRPPARGPAISAATRRAIGDCTRGEFPGGNRRRYEA